MEVVVVTTPDKMQSEIPEVIELFKAGLDTLHLRKTKFSTSRLAQYIDAIPQKYHSRIIIHTHHKLAFKYNLKGIHLSKKHRKKNLSLFLKVVWIKIRKPKLKITRSFHQLETLQENKFRFQYAFLNPFFTKIDHLKNSFDVNPEYMRKILGSSVCPVYASGNITTENISELKKYGVSGVALSKILWQHKGNKIDFYTELCKKINA